MGTVLIVDDDTDLAECFAELLRSRGHEVRTAHCGAEGLRLLRTTPLPEIVLLDVAMPKMSGPQMAHQMFIHNAGEEKIPVILFSARADLQQIAERMGTPYFVTKAASLGEFTDAFDRALRERIAPSSA